MRTSALHISLLLLVGAFTGPVTGGIRGQEPAPAGDPDHEVVGDSMLMVSVSGTAVVTEKVG